MQSTMLLALLLPAAGLAWAAATPPVAPVSKIIDPQWPFTDNCTEWELYPLQGPGVDTVALWAVCPFAGNRVTSLLSFESTLIGTDVAITPSWPSGSASVPFSSVCSNCRLDPPTSTTMSCDCSTNTEKAISIDLYWWVTTLNGVLCYTDGDECAQITATTPEAA